MENELFVNLDFNDVFNLVSSIAPSYKQMDYYINLGLGSYTGGHVEKWSWRESKLRKLDIEDLYHIYLEIKYDK